MLLSDKLSKSYNIYSYFIRIKLMVISSPVTLIILLIMYIKFIGSGKAIQ